MDLTRLRNGQCPLLCGHDPDCQIGILENASVDADGVLRADARFSRGVEGEEEWQDVQDGIRTSISVGYWPHEMRLESEVDGVKTYLVTRWEPCEASLVSIPADPTVGVGRTAEHNHQVRILPSLDPTPTIPAAPAGTARKESPMPTPEEIAAAQKAAEELQRTNVLQITRAERVEALQLSGIAQRHGCGQEAAEILASDKPLVEARKLILEMVAKRDAVPLQAPLIDPSLREMQTYSLVRAMNAMSNRENCPELELSQELGKRLGRATDGFFFPTNLPSVQRAGLDSATATKGAELKYTEAGGWIDVLRNKALVLKLGAEFMPGLQGKIGFSRQTGAATLVWLATENPGSDAADSNLTTDLVTIDAKTAIATTSISKQLLLQSAFPAEAKVRNDLAAIVALGLDLAAINGSGASGQPKGILNQSGIGAVALGTNGLIIPSVAALVDLETAVATQNADIGALGYLTTPGQRGVMKKTPAFSTAGAAPIWTEGPVGSDMGWVNGYKAGASAQVPNNLTKGTSSGVCHAVIFGNFNELIIGEWGALEVLLDPYRLKKQGMIELTATYFCDVAVKHGASFAAIKDAL